jgi:serine protease Do
MKPTIVLPVLLALAPAPAAQEPDEILVFERALRAAVAKVAPSVVTIETFGGTRKFLGDQSQLAGGRPGPRGQPEPEDPEDPGDPAPMPPRLPGQQPPEPAEPERKKLGPIVMPGFLQAQGATTGIVLSEDGWILTSRFNFSFDPSTILVTTTDGRKFTGKLMGQDTGRGLALVKVEADGLPVPRVGDPASAKVGQWVAILGRSFGGKDPSVHAGIVSALGRLHGRAIQTDASASPANYGGPLIDLEGRVLGVVTPLSPDGREASADWYDSGIGFAATWVDVPGYIDRLRRGETVGAGFLGITMDLGYLGPGALIATVLAASPAAGSGLQGGDLVAELDGVPVRHNFHLQDLIGRRAAGDLVSLVVRRPPGAASKPVVKLPVAAPPAPQRAPRKFDPEAEKPTSRPAAGGEVLKVTVLLGEKPAAERAPDPPTRLPKPGEPEPEDQKE